MQRIEAPETMLTLISFQDRALGQQVTTAPYVAHYGDSRLHIGSPTRLINHTCDTNCAIYSLSYNHADTSISQLASFALTMIPSNVCGDG